MRKNNIILLILLLIFFGCKIVYHGEKKKETVKEGKVYFDADLKNYVEMHWDEKIYPFIINNSIDIHTVLNDVNENTDEAVKKYGHREETEGNPWNFIVKGKGKILNIDASSANGKITIDLSPFDNKEDLIIQIGPMVKGDSLRNAIDFITFDQFKNQLEFGDLSNELKNKSKLKVLKELGFNSFEELKNESLLKSLINKEIEFYGTFTPKTDSVSKKVIIPVKNIILIPVKINLL